MINERNDLIQDCIDRTAQTRDEVLEMLKQSKTVGFTAVSEEDLSNIWANLGNIMYELRNANDELNSLVDFINVSIPIPE